MRIIYTVARASHLAYYHFPTTTQFTLGEAIAALGLIFAVIQLAKPVWNIILDIKGRYTMRVVWSLLILALFSILVSSLLEPATNKTAVIANPLLWQIVAFMSFATSPFCLFIFSTRIKGLFNERTAKRFYHRLSQEVSTGDPKRIAAAIDIIWYNLDSIMEATKDKFSKDLSKDSKKDNIYQQYAHSLIAIVLTDTKVVSYIATERIDFIINFTKAIKDKGLRRYKVGDSFNTLVTELYTNPDSYLYRQQEDKGTGLYASVNNTIFGSKYFLREFQPIKMWKYYGLDVGITHAEAYIEVFLRSLETAIKKDAFKDYEIGEQISYILFTLNDYVRELVTSDTEPGKFNRYKRIIQKIETLYGTTFINLYTEAVKNNKVSGIEEKAEKQGRYSRQQSLTAAYADALAEFLGEIGNYDKENIFLRLMASNATENLISYIPQGKVTDNILKTFFEYIWDLIKQNVEQGAYPTILRAYIPAIYLFGLTSTSKIIKNERQKLIDYMNQVVKPKLKDNLKMNDRATLMESVILPNEVEYVRVEDKFFWLDVNKNRSDFK